MYGLAVYKSSIYLGPGINLVHLISMCTFMGALLMVDLRLLGTGVTNRPVKHVARTAEPWLIAGLIGLTITGIPALMSTATMQYASNVFWFKMYVLAFAVIFTFTVRRKVVESDEGRVPPFFAKIVALLSDIAWKIVAAG